MKYSNNDKVEFINEPVTAGPKWECVFIRAIIRDLLRGTTAGGTYYEVENQYTLKDKDITVLYWCDRDDTIKAGLPLVIKTIHSVVDKFGLSSDKFIYPENEMNMPENPSYKINGKEYTFDDALKVINAQGYYDYTINKHGIKSEEEPKDKSAETTQFGDDKI